MKKTFVKNAAVLTAGGMVAKGIGALYRIPLSSLLGGYGMGLYHMAYPLFCVLLTFSSAGIPTAFSKLSAEEAAAGRDGRQILFAALRLFAFLGLVGSLCMALLAPFMSTVQGESALLPCYLALAPAVFLVALIAVFRGYFQGRREMAPTAASEICEQLFKAGLGLLFALRFPHDPARAAAGALFSVTLSELFALLLLVRRYRGEPRRPFLGRKASGVSVLSAALPVMAAASLLPLSQMADSLVIVRLLAGKTARAVALYGLYAGGALSLVGLPAAVCGGLSAASVPSVAACTARGDREGARHRVFRALALTLALSLPCAIGLFLFANPAVHILYPGLSLEDTKELVSLVRLMSVSAATLSCVNTLSSCLTGMGKAKCAALSMLLAVSVKLILEAVLVGGMGIGGAAVAVNVCYLVAFLLQLIYTVTESKKEREHDHDRRIGNGAGRRLRACREGNEGGKGGSLEHRLSARRRGLEGGGDPL